MHYQYVYDIVSSIRLLELADEVFCNFTSLIHHRPFSYHGNSSNGGSEVNGPGSFERLNEPVIFLVNFFITMLLFL